MCEARFAKMPTTKKQESEAKKSESEMVRRQSIAGSSQADHDMPKAMEEIKSMIKDLKKDMSSKLRSIDDKFSNIITELREDIGEVRNDLAQANTDIQNIQRQMEEVDKSIEFHAEKVKSVERQQQEQFEEINRKLNDKVDTLNKKLMMVEKHERKYNLIFHGIQEERSEKLYDKMRAFFVSHLEIDQERAEKIIFSNGHRMPTKVVGMPKPVIMRFARYDDRELILSKAYKLAKSGKKILTDLPVAMKEERARLAKEAFLIREKEHLKTRIRDVGLDLVLEVRKDVNDKWLIRKS